MTAFDIIFTSYRKYRTIKLKSFKNNNPSLNDVLKLEPEKRPTFMQIFSFANVKHAGSVETLKQQYKISSM